MGTEMTLDPNAVELACIAHAPQWDGIDPVIQKYAREQMRSAITAYLFAAPQPVPEGWKLAAETEALLDAADEVLESMDDSGLARNGVDLVPLRNAAAKFKAAMLAAAPEATHE